MHCQGSLRQSAAVLLGCSQQDRYFRMENGVFGIQPTRSAGNLSGYFFTRESRMLTAAARSAEVYVGEWEFEPKILVPSIVVNATVPCLCPKRSHSPCSERYRSITRLAISRRIASAGPRPSQGFSAAASRFSVPPPLLVHCPPSGLPAGTRG